MLAIYLLLGLFAGLLSGLLGVGGGVIVVPGLAFIFRHNNQIGHALIMHMAVGTSLAIMVFTSLSTAYAYYRKQLISWPVFYRFIPGLLVGIGAGAFVGKKLSTDHLTLLFAGFLIIIAIKILFFSKSVGKQTQAEAHALQKPIQLPDPLFLFLVSFLVGTMSAMFGIGGGLLMVPFFLYIGLDMLLCSGTSSLCSVPIAIIGTLSLVITGIASFPAEQIPVYATGFVYWPAVAMVSMTSALFAPLGARLAIFFETKTIQRIFVGLIIITVVNLF